MVTRSRSRRGASTLGCLLSLLLTMVVLYYGMNAGRVWWRYYALLDDMKKAALFAGNTPDDQILRGLQSSVVENGLPPAAARFRINRTPAPRQITISTNYQETIELPFFHKKVAFNPSVTHRL